MKTSTLICIAAAVAHTVLFFDSTKGLFFGTLDLLPFTALTGLGGMTGLKLAVAMKLLGRLEWRNAMSHGVGLRKFFEKGMLPEHFASEPAKPHYSTTRGVPLDLIPYFPGGDLKRWAPFKTPESDFVIFVDQSGNPYSSEDKLSSASVNVTKRLFQQSFGNLNSPPVNTAAKKAVAKATRAAESGPNMIEKAMSLVRKLDVDGCILRLSCEVGARPQSYGKYGRRVTGFVASVGTVPESSPIYPYKAAFWKGKSNGFDSCAREYSKCKDDLNELVEFINSQ